MAFILAMQHVAVNDGLALELANFLPWRRPVSAAVHDLTGLLSKARHRSTLHAYGAGAAEDPAPGIFSATGGPTIARAPSRSLALRRIASSSGLSAPLSHPALSDTGPSRRTRARAVDAARVQAAASALDGMARRTRVTTISIFISRCCVLARVPFRTQEPRAIWAYRAGSRRPPAPGDRRRAVCAVPAALPTSRTESKPRVEAVCVARAVELRSLVRSAAWGSPRCLLRLGWRSQAQRSRAHGPRIAHSPSRSRPDRAIPAPLAGHARFKSLACALPASQ
ncbi:hypothetical protein K488DRAFT_88196 [Vararia minispora EC-137]|uniref:Uncharacterized protein n=1 Tax=Vararia minispora EC-137 TaxID=1314806 RepID=A0ACB8QEI1_9AGAM|nr:hypothetical protein K488DRAFT_88196 [Vararia minispora EC-137]